MINKIITFILNYIVAPILGILFVIWEFFKKLFSDVMKHMYGKILIPILATVIFYYIFNFIK